MSHNPKLLILWAYSNGLNTLDVSRNPALENLNVISNNLTILNVSSNPELTELQASSNNLRSLDTSGNPKLFRLTAASNNLSTLDVSGNPELEYLAVSSNTLNSLNVSGNPKLYYLNAESNSLRSLDLSGNPEMKFLYLNQNQLSSLDASRNPELANLHVNQNQLSSLDFSENSKLRELKASDNICFLEVSSLGTYDLAALPGNFDPAKASNWVGGYVNGSTLTVDEDAEMVPYTYDCGNGMIMESKFNITWPTTLATPVLKTAGIASTGIKLIWDAVPRANEYRVLYRVYGESVWRTAGDTTSNEYTVTGLDSGIKYSVSVRCIDMIGSYNSLPARSKHVTYVASPTIESVVNSADGVTVKWGKISGANQYRVFYRAYGSSNWLKAGMTTGTNYTVTGLTSGTKYSFAVRCMNSASKYLNNISASKHLVYVARPTISKVSNAANGITVKWSKAAGTDKYRVFYRVYGSSKWLTAGTTAGTSYTVTGLTSGKKYSFAVRPMNSSGKYLNNITPSKHLLCLATPAVQAAKASKGVRVTWSKISGASGYHIYRKVSGGSWVKIKSVNGSASVNWTDTTAKSGTRYYYTVRAYNGSTQGYYKTAGAAAIAG